MKPKDFKPVLASLKARFDKHPKRHPNIAWAAVEGRLKAASAAQLRALQAMETTGGEPDVIGQDAKTGAVVFCDCAGESPEGRRSLCFDRQALDSRKENKPEGSAIDLATEMGVTILSEAQYRNLQQLGEFDNKTSSWVETPSDIRKLGGALFCDRRYGKVFVYHNGAQSYYAARGFRASIEI